MGYITRMLVALLFCFSVVLETSTGETGVRLFGGNYALTSSFKLPSLQQLTVCTWVKLANIPASRSHERQHILSYYEPGRPALFSLALQPPIPTKTKQGEIIMRLNQNIFSAKVSAAEFNSYYDRWKSFCFSWDLTHKGILTFVDGGFIQHHVSATYLHRAVIAGGFPLVIGQYLYSYSPQTVVPNTAFTGDVGSVQIWNSVSDRVSIQEKIDCRSVATVYNMRASDLLVFSNGGMNTTVPEIANSCSLIACPNPESQLILPGTTSYSKPIITSYGIPIEGSSVRYRCNPGHTLYPATSSGRTCLKKGKQNLVWSGAQPYCLDPTTVLTSAGNVPALPPSRTLGQTGSATVISGTGNTVNTAGSCAGGTGIQLFGGTYVLTSSFKLPPLQQLTMCAWVKLSTRSAMRGNDRQHILSYFEPGQPELLSLSLRAPSTSNLQQGEIIARLNYNLYTVSITAAEFKSYYNRWKGFCFSWDLTNTGISIFVDGQLRQHTRNANNFQRVTIAGGWPLVIGQYLYSYSPQSVVANTAFDGTVGSVKVWNTVSDVVSIQGRYKCRSLPTVYDLIASDLQPFSSGVSPATLTEMADVCSLIACPDPACQFVSPSAGAYIKPIITYFHTYQMLREGATVYHSCNPGFTVFPVFSNRRTCVKAGGPHLQWSGTAPHCLKDANRGNAAPIVPVVPASANQGPPGPANQNPTGVAMVVNSGQSLSITSVTQNNVRAAGGGNSSTSNVSTNEEAAPPLVAILVPILTVLFLGACVAAILTYLYKTGRLRKFPGKASNQVEEGQGKILDIEKTEDEHLYESVP